MIRALLCWFGFHSIEQHVLDDEYGITSYIDTCKHCKHSRKYNDCVWQGWNP